MPASASDVYAVVDDVPAGRHADFRFKRVGLFFGQRAQFRQQFQAEAGGLVFHFPERIVDAGNLMDGLVELSRKFRRCGAVVGIQHQPEHPPDLPVLLLRVGRDQFGQPHQLREDAGVTVGLHAHGQFSVSGRRTAFSRICFRFLKPANAASRKTASTAARNAMNHSPWRT